MATSGGSTIQAARAPFLVAVANPAAGANWSWVATQQFRLCAVSAVLATSAAVANRFVTFKISSGANSVWQDQPITQVASQTAGYSLYPGVGGQGVGNSPFQCSMPSLLIPVGWTIASTTPGLDVADQWSAVVITGEVE